MKKVIADILLLSIVAPFLTIGITFHYQRQRVREEIKESIIAGMDKQDLVLLKFSQVETETLLRWKDKGEFEYNGEMYDIVEKQIQGDSTWYWCWPDQKETRLNRKADILATQAIAPNPRNKENSKRFFNFIKLLYAAESSSQDILLFAEMNFPAARSGVSCLSIFISSPQAAGN